MISVMIPKIVNFSIKCLHMFHLKKLFRWTQVLFVGPLIPSEFQSQGGSSCLRASSLAHQILQIHLWCDTCWPLHGQHGKWGVSSTYLHLRTIKTPNRCWTTQSVNTVQNRPHNPMGILRHLRKSSDVGSKTFFAGSLKFSLFIEWRRLQKIWGNVLAALW